MSCYNYLQEEAILVEAEADITTMALVAVMVAEAAVAAAITTMMKMITKIPPTPLRQRWLV